MPPHRRRTQQLHFSKPEVYHEIYNATNRWDKEPALYHSFGEDRSSFGFLEYKDAKPRKDILSRIFSKRAITDAESLVQEKVSSDKLPVVPTDGTHIAQAVRASL